MAIVTISRQKGSLGYEIARALADKIDYDYVGKTKLSEAMADGGLPRPEFDKFDGKGPSIWQSMFNQKKKFTFLLRAAIYEYAGKGDVVILGQGGQALLKDIPGTLHVRIVAPLKVRTKRLMDLEGCGERIAAQLLVQADRDASAYTRSFFDVDWDDSSLYNLLINTRTMTVETASALIIAAITDPDFSQLSKGAEVNLEDMALVEKTRGTLVGLYRGDLTRIEASEGVVSLPGMAGSKKSIQECKNLVSQIKGVKKVEP